jgi:hypothetical protein
VLRLQWIFENIARSVVISSANDTKASFASVVSDLFRKSSGLIVPAQLCSAIDRGLNEAETSWHDLITAEELKKLALLVVAKIEELAQGRKLKAHIHSAMLVFFWRRWGNLKDIKQWIGTTTRDADGLLWFLNAVSTIADFPDPQLLNNPFRFKIELLEEFVDLAALETIHTLDQTALSEKGRKLTESFIVAFNRRVGV